MMKSIALLVILALAIGSVSAKNVTYLSTVSVYSNATSSFCGVDSTTCSFTCIGITSLSSASQLILLHNPLKAVPVSLPSTLTQVSAVGVAPNYACSTCYTESSGDVNCNEPEYDTYNFYTLSAVGSATTLADGVSVYLYDSKVSRYCETQTSGQVVCDLVSPSSSTGVFTFYNH